MICVIPDTNILLNSIKADYDDFYFLNTLQYLVWNKKIVLAIPEQVKIEWDRHANDVLEGAKVTLNHDLTRAMKLKKFVLPQSVDDFAQSLDKVNSELEKMVSYRIEKKVNVINELIDKHSVLIPTEQNFKLKAADWALEKFPPFFGSKNKQEQKEKDLKMKNSMADAIIFLSAVDHVQNNNYESAYFVTENFVDFSKSADKKIIHDNLAALMPEVLKYEINIQKFIYEISRETNFKVYTYEESQQMEKLIEQEYLQKIQYPNNTVICPRCSTTLDDKVDGYWHHSLYGDGLSWWRRCTKCGLQWDSGDLYD